MWSVCDNTLLATGEKTKSFHSIRFIFCMEGKFGDWRRREAKSCEGFLV